MGMRIKTFGAAMGLAIILTAGGVDAAPAREGQAAAAPAPIPAGAPIPAEAMRQDFADLYAGVKQAHYDLYARTSRADYDRLFADMNAGITGPMSRAEAAAFFQHFMAFGHIAHARVDAASEAWGAYRQAGGRAFPLDIRIRDERIFVALNGSGSALIAPGDEIVSIDGIAAPDWFARASTLMSADTPYMLGTMMESGFRRLLWSELGDVAGFDLVLRRGDAERFTVTVPALSPTDLTAAQAGQPSRLDLSWTAREARMLGDGVAYLRPGPTYDVEAQTEATAYDNTAFKAFVGKAFEDFLDAGATDLILDLRDNPGGDNSFSDLLLAWFATRPFHFTSSFTIRVSQQTTASNAARLTVAGNDPTGISAAMARAYAGATPGTAIDFPIPMVEPRAGRRFIGRVFALINRRSYSNTVAMAATLQDYGFATLLGEETSDLATTYGAMETFALPRTGLVVGYPKAFIVRPDGDRAARGVAPDIAIETPIVEGPNDPVLEQVLARVKASRGPPKP
jgi:hypothetical protein